MAQNIDMLIRWIGKFEVQVGAFIKELNREYHLDADKMQKILDEMKNSTDFSIQPKSVAKANDNVSLCKAILKRKGTVCGNKVSAKSTTGEYCSKHLKIEIPSQQEDDAQDLLFQRNSYGNFS